MRCQSVFEFSFWPVQLSDRGAPSNGEGRVVKSPTGTSLRPMKRTRADAVCASPAAKETGFIDQHQQGRSLAWAKAPVSKSGIVGSNPTAPAKLLDVNDASAAGRNAP